MKTVNVNLTPKSIDAAIAEIEKYKNWINKTIPVFLQALADRGVEIYNADVKLAIYDGDNDVSAHVEKNDNHSVAVVAVGNATLFIEFGTGVLFPDSHPEAAKLGMKHGEFGHKLAKRGTWRYKGNPGTNGEIITSGKHAGEVRTIGNPPNMTMYYTIRDLEKEFTDIAKKVFTYD